MKALKSDKANSLVSVDWNTMTAKASDGTQYRLSAVSSTPTSGAVEIHQWRKKPTDIYPNPPWYDGREEDARGDTPECIWSQFYEGRTVLAAPSHPSEAKAGESFYTFTKPEGWINLVNPGQSWEEWTREQGLPTTKGWRVDGAKAGEDA